MSGNGKKGLWVALAISVFVLVVLGAAFFLFAPSKSTQATPLDLSGKAAAKAENPSDFLQGQPGTTGDLTVQAPSSELSTSQPSGVQTTTTNSSGDIIILYGDNTKSGQSGQSGQSGSSAVSAPLGKSESSQTAEQPAQTIVTPPKTTTTSQNSAPAPAATKPVAKPAAKPAASPSGASSAPASAQPAAPTPKTTAVAQPSSGAGSYFIQAGSFRTKSTADSLLSDLQKRNLSGKVAIKDIDGVSYYQVKVGPYATREEAKKSLPSVVAVPGVSPQAFVTQ
jgi:DedD protein